MFESVLKEISGRILKRFVMKSLEENKILIESLIERFITIYLEKSLHKILQESGKIHAEKIDHVLIDGRHCSDIIEVRTDCGEVRPLSQNHTSGSRTNIVGRIQILLEYNINMYQCRKREYCRIR